jgi:hypothetical protein
MRSLQRIRFANGLDNEIDRPLLQEQAPAIRQDTRGGDFEAHR